MTVEEFEKEYTRLGHAIQSGVAMEQNYRYSATEPKHLRTGLNTVMCDTASLAILLVKKGLITQEEYQTAVLEGLKAEVARYEKRISEHVGGGKITLK